MFLAVANQIEAMLPYSAALLRAGSFEAMKRLVDAERAYRTALRLANQQSPAPRTASLVLAHKRLAAMLNSKGDRQAALREYLEVLKLVPDDAESQAAIRASRGN